MDARLNGLAARSRRRAFAGALVAMNCVTPAHAFDFDGILRAASQATAARQALDDMRAAATGTAPAARPATSGQVQPAGQGSSGGYEAGSSLSGRAGEAFETLRLSLPSKARLTSDPAAPSADVTLSGLSAQERTQVLGALVVEMAKLGLHSQERFAVAGLSQLFYRAPDARAVTLTYGT